MKTADVQFGVVMTTTDEHSVSTLASHVGQRHGLIVKHQVRDRPGIPHQLLNGRVSKSSCSLGLNVRPVTCPLPVETQGGVMTTLQAMCLGAMLAWTPSLVVLALLLRAAPVDDLEGDPS
jgi:hypothetical protein